ncbi:MAG: ABC transporter permease, partial [Flavobacteriaceae bacterium]|nr:ABC transporter permease [Flavobacteriaceae bacterium]
ACINFVNISTANSISRSKEIGIRKVLGSDRKNLIMQFMGEFSILTFIAAFLSVILLTIILPYFNQFTGKELSLGLTFLTVFSATVILTALFGGSYPAFYLSSFTPQRILKNKFSVKKNGISLKSALVIFQFCISILLIISTILVNNQLSFIQNKKLGFDKNNVIYIPAKGELAEKFESTKNQFLQYPNIENVSMSEGPPLENLSGSFVTWQKHKEKNIVLRIMQVTPDYFGTMNIKSTSGRLFSEKLTTDNNTFILNEAAIKYLGIQSPVGKTIKTFGKEGEIIGVVNDTHFKSLHHQLEPLIFMPLPLKRYGNLDYTAGSIIIKFSGNDISKVLSNAKSIWQKYNPGLPFEYHFLDKTIEQKYGFEQRLSKIFTGFSLLAIFISCLGLFALITFVAINRTKEIGVRKVLGASNSKIVMLLSKDFIKWAL